MKDHCKQNFPLSGRNPRNSHFDRWKSERPRALYVHVPFCVAKCSYCDFFSCAADTPLIERYIVALESERRRMAALCAESLDTIYFGGGTPTMLSAANLTRVCGSFGAMLSNGGEFSVEANPATLNDAKIKALRDGGVNRVTLGAQSFVPEELARLGRIHSACAISESVRDLRRGGMENLGLDLIYAIPGQTLASWQRSLREAIALGVDHVSCYALSIEPGTPLWRQRERGEFDEMDDALQREMYDLARETLAATGLAQYEISNFARPGRESRHNLVYWRNQPYAAIGPAAAGYIAGRRWTNCPDLDAWLAAVEAGDEPPCGAEELTGPLAMAETVMLGLRLREGIELVAFAERYGRALEDVFPRSVAKHLANGNLRHVDGHIMLSEDALFLSDSVFADCIDEATSSVVQSGRGENSAT